MNKLNGSNRQKIDKAKANMIIPLSILCIFFVYFFMDFLQFTENILIFCNLQKIYKKYTKNIQKKCENLQKIDKGYTENRQRIDIKK